MLKTGICDLADLAVGGSRKFVAVSLYRTVAASDRPDRDALLEQILVRFPTRNASLKRTQARRFAGFDRAVAEQIRERRTPGKTLRVHDAGVSDGRTAADFFELLTGIEGLDVEVTASDYAPDVEVVEDSRSRLALVLDPDGTLLQIVWPPFVFNVQLGESPWLYPGNHLLRAWLLRGRVPDLLRRHRAGDGSTQSHAIRLLHPRCLALCEGEPRFRFERHDLMKRFAARYDVIRAMNVLNPTYFDAARLATAVGHVARALEPGGLFVTGSNADAGSTVDGAVYERTDDGFERRFVSGAGSPVDAQVRAVTRAT